MPSLCPPRRDWAQRPGSCRLSGRVANTCGGPARDRGRETVGARPSARADRRGLPSAVPAGTPTGERTRVPDADARQLLCMTHRCQ